jgi:hypothetical protein
MPMSHRLCRWPEPQVCQKPLETRQCLWPYNRRLHMILVHAQLDSIK